MSSAGQAVRTLRAGFAAPPPDGRVMMRWWWFGPFVEEAELARELEAMAAAGIGGVEVAYVYPLSTSDADREAGGFLSERFLSRLRFAAETASRLGLRFDVTLGSGWSYGGPHVTDDTAARRLRWDAREVPPRPLRIATEQPWPGDELVAAYVGDGSEQEPPTSWEQLPVHDGSVHVPEGSGPRVVLLAVSSPTGQNVKRAAAGAEGPVLDHCSRAATEAHLRAVADPILAAVGSELVTAVFCDSLEVYAADWTPALPAEFRARRGYDLLPELPLLHSRAKAPSASAPTSRRRSASCTRRTSSRSCGRGCGSTTCCSASRATGSRPARCRPTGTPTCRRARAGAGARSPRPSGRRRPRTSTSGRSSPRRHGPGCTPRPSPPPRSTSPVRRTSTCSSASTSSSATAGRTRLPARPAGSSTRPVRSTTRTRGGPPCPNSPGTCTACAGCCGRASRSSTSRSTPRAGTRRSTSPPVRAATSTSGTPRASTSGRRCPPRCGRPGTTTTSSTTRPSPRPTRIATAWSSCRPCGICRTPPRASWRSTPPS